MKLEFKIENQSLERIDDNKAVDLSNNYLECGFSFSEDWDDFARFVIFRCNKKSYRVAIEDTSCFVPYDVLKADKFLITVYGVKEDVRITTNYLWIHLRKSAFVDEYDESSYFNPDMTEELLDIVEQKVYTSVFNETVDEINTAIENLDESKVDKSQYNTDLQGIHNSISEVDNAKVSKTDYNTDMNVVNNTLVNLNDSKVNKIDYNTDLAVVNSTLVDLANNKVNVTDFNETTVDIYDKINVLEHIEVIQVVTDKGEASQETMNKLFIEVKSDKVDVYYTKYDEEEGYYWVKMDDNILDDLDINWNDVQGKPTTFPPSEHTHSYSALTNKPFIPSKTSDLVNDVPFLTEHQDISSKADKSYVDTELNKKADKTSIPTKTSQLTNDVPFLTEHQSLDAYYTKSEVDELIEEMNNKIVVDATKDIIQTDENIDIKARVKENGFMVENKKVHFYKLEEDE